jgi:hypothetical protein
MEEINLQKVNVKVFLDAAQGLEADALLAVFGRWRLEEGEEIVDLADYAHVPEGPGILLVSHRWHFGVDWDGGRPGLFYSSRKGLEGSLEERFAAVIRAGFEKGRRLLAEPELRGSAQPLAGELEVVINDRLLAPNTDQSDAALRPALEAALKRLYAGGSYELRRDADPSRRLGYRVSAAVPAGVTFEALISRLG